MTTRQVSIRLGTEGKTQVKNDFAEVERAGNQAFDNIGKSAQQSGVVAQKSVDDVTRAVTALGQVRASASAATIDSALGIGGRSAAQSGGGYRALAAEFKAQEAAADALRSKLDPLYAAQARYNREVEAADKLLRTKAITDKEYAQYLGVEKRALDEATESAKRNAAAMARGGRPLSRGEMMNGRLNLARQGADVFTTAASGMNPGLIAVQQGPQILEALASSGLRVTGVMAGAAAATVLLGGAVVATAAHVAESDRIYRDFDATLTRISDGSRYSAAQLATDAQALKSLGGAAKESTAAVQTFVASGVDPSRMLDFSRAARASADVLKIDLTQAADTAAKAFTGGYNEIRELDKSLNFLTASELEHIKVMFDSGQAARGRSEALDIYRNKMEDAASKANGPWREAFRGLKNAWNEFLDSLANTGPMKEAFGLLELSARGWSGMLSQFKADEAKSAEELFSEYGATRLKLNQAISAQETNSDHSLGRDVTLGLRTHKLQTRAAELTALLSKASEKSADTIVQTSNAKEKAWIGSIQLGNAELESLKTERQKIVDGLAAGFAKVGGQLDPARQSAANAKIAELDRKIADAEKPKKVPGAGRAASLAREAESVRVNTAETLKLAEAYLKSDDAALKAEARRKALTAATRKGTDTETAMRDQLANTVAQEAANAAKAAAGTRAQADAQASINKQVAAGTLRVEDMSRALQAEQATRSARVALMAVEGDRERLLSSIRASEAAKTTGRTSALTQALADEDARRKILMQSIDAQREALTKLNTEQGKANLLAQMAADDAELRRLQLEIDLLGELDEKRAIAIAGDQARREVEREIPNFDPKNPEHFGIAADRILKAEDVARANAAYNRGRSLEDLTRSQEDTIALQQRELELQGASQQYRESELNQLRLKQDLVRQGVPLASAEMQARLKAQEVIDDNNETLTRARAMEAERSALQDRMFDNLQRYLEEGKFSWKSFGDLARSELASISASLIKMALINPLRNWALGENNPTINDADGSGSGLAKFATSLFGMGSGKRASEYGTVTMLPDWASTLDSLPRHASGTDNAPGGWSWVGENGPELRKLRPGDVIRSAPDSTRMMGKALGVADDMRRTTTAPPVIHNHHHYHLEGAITTAELWKQVDGKVAAGETRAKQAAVNEALEVTSGSIGGMMDNHRSYRA